LKQLFKRKQYNVQYASILLVRRNIIGIQTVSNGISQRKWYVWFGRWYSWSRESAPCASKYNRDRVSNGLSTAFFV